MLNIRTKISSEGFTIGIVTDSPSQAVVHYVANGSGGRQTSGSVTLDGVGESLVRVHFPVLTVGITDLEIVDGAGKNGGLAQRTRGIGVPAVLGLITSSILTAGLMAGRGHAATPDRSVPWRDAGVEAAAPSFDYPAVVEPFAASG